MAIQNRARDVRRATREWMTEKQKLRFNRQFTTEDTVRARNHVKEVYDSALPSLWRKYQEAKIRREADVSAQSVANARMQIGHALLMSCVHIQDAYVWQRVVEEGNALESMRFSFKNIIDPYLDELRMGKTAPQPISRLNGSYPEAVGSAVIDPESSKKIIPTLRCVVGLAITGLLEPEQWPEGTALRLPDPFILSDELIPREFPIRYAAARPVHNVLQSH